MPHLPAVNLDDRTFQDLVSEARTRISQACPEWTEHNVSDPGITLVELFAWMTELTIYRLNRIPDKLHVELLELIGIRLAPPSAARADLRLRLTRAADETVAIPRGATEVGTPRTPADEPIVFQTSEDFTIRPLRPAAYVLRRGGKVTSIALASGVARPHGTDQLAFGTPPKPGDALHLGFEDSVARLLLRIEVEASPAGGIGIDPRDPPLRWEVSSGGDEWLRADVLMDLTGGFNTGSGIVELQLPDRSATHLLGGKWLHWVRCRIDKQTASGKEGAAYNEAPEIYSITAAPVGASLPASHSALADTEVLGMSDGTPGQRFALRKSPVLPLERGETLEVQVPGEVAWTAWEARESLATSGPRDKHFAMDLVSGQVEFGPAIRETDGSWTQYGATPPRGAMLRFTGYRHGGGRRGNVAAGTLTMLKSSIAGIDTVVNPRPAVGGVDAEPLATARQRAAMEIRSRYRAVTTQDYEFLAREASSRIARALCVPPEAGGAISLYLLPNVDPADRRLRPDELIPEPELYKVVADYLDERRMIGATVQLLPVPLRTVSVVVHVQTSASADVRRVEKDIAHALYTYINPIVGGSAHGPGEGWPFGRPLNQGELFGIVHAIDGVEFAKILRVFETDPVTGKKAPEPIARVDLGADELLASGEHIVQARREV